MTHLADSEIVDVVERRADERAVRHLETCAACRDRLEEARSVLALVAEEHPPAPPGAFWDHFGDRVNRAIDAPARARGWVTTGRLAWTVSLACLLVAFGISVVLRDVPRSTDGPDRGPVSRAEQEAIASWESDGDEDEAWALVRAMAHDLDFELVREAGLAPAAGSIDRAAAELSEEERAELARLIEDEMKRTDS